MMISHTRDILLLTHYSLFAFGGHRCDPISFGSFGRVASASSDRPEIFTFLHVSPLPPLYSLKFTPTPCTCRGPQGSNILSKVDVPWSTMSNSECCNRKQRWR